MFDVLISTHRWSISTAWETTGHTLSFAINMLAVHQEEQEVSYQDIQEVIMGGRLPVNA